MSIYGRTIACLRQKPIETSGFLLVIYLLGEMPNLWGFRGICMGWIAARLAQGALDQMLWGKSLSPALFPWRMLAALTLVALPPFVIATAMISALPETEPMMAGLIAFLVLSACVLSWTALTGTALLSAARNEPLSLHRTLSEARVAAWATVRAIVLGPILGGTGVLVGLGVLTALVDAALPSGWVADVILNLAMDMAIIFVAVLAMASLVSAWEKGHAPPSRAEVFA